MFCIAKVIIINDICKLINTFNKDVNVMLNLKIYLDICLKYITFVVGLLYDAREGVSITR